MPTNLIINTTLVKRSLHITPQVVQLQVAAPVAAAKMLVVNQGSPGLSAYQLALQNGFTGTLPQWLESLQGEQGLSLEIDVIDGAIYVRQQGGTWQLFVTAEEITGADGKSVELQKTATHIQWRQQGGSWINLVALADIQGPAGPNQVTTDTNTNISGLLFGSGANSKVGAATPAQAQQAVIPALTNTARLQLNGLPTPYRVYDTDWRADFLWDGTQWEQMTTPIVNDAAMALLPNPQPGYKVFNTTWGSEHTWVGPTASGFWQGQRRVVKPSATSYSGTTLVADPHLRLPITSGLWLIQIRCIITSSPGGWRYTITGPTWSAFSTSIQIGGSANFLVTRNSATGTAVAASSGANNLVGLQEFRWRSSGDGEILFNVAQNTANGSGSILADSEILGIKII